jgi:hypothetical protein
LRPVIWFDGLYAIDQKHGGDHNAIADLPQSLEHLHDRRDRDQKHDQDHPEPSGTSKANAGRRQALRVP